MYEKIDCHIIGISMRCWLSCCTKLARDIEALENEKKELTIKLEQQLDYKEIEKIGNRIGEITDLIDEKELRWLELDEIS